MPDCCDQPPWTCRFYGTGYVHGIIRLLWHHQLRAWGHAESVPGGYRVL